MLVADSEGTVAVGPGLLISLRLPGYQAFENLELICGTVD